MKKKKVKSTMTECHKNYQVSVARYQKLLKKKHNLNLAQNGTHTLVNHCITGKKQFKHNKFTIQCNTMKVQYNAIQLRYNTMQYNTMQYNEGTIRCNTRKVQYNAIQLRYNTMQYNTMQYNEGTKRCNLYLTI